MVDALLVGAKGLTAGVLVYAALPARVRVAEDASRSCTGGCWIFRVTAGAS